MVRSRLVSRCAWFATLLLSASLVAQSPNDIGLRPGQSYDGDNESIGLANGNLNVSIPLVKRSQRGAKSLSIALTYNSSTWSPSLQPKPGGGLQWVWSQPYTSPFMAIGAVGWQLNAPNAVGQYLAAGEGASNSYFTFYNKELEEVQLSDYKQLRQPYYAWIGTDDANHRSLIYEGGPSLRYMFPDGSQYIGLGGDVDPAYLTQHKILDRNGNATTFKYNVASDGNGGVSETTAVVDNTGRVYTLTTQHSLNSQETVVRSGVFSYREVNGSLTQLQLFFGLPGTVDDGTPLFTNPAQSIVIAPSADMKAGMLSAIVLPNGLTYTFHYNEYLELTKVTYPSGGYTRYEYTPFVVHGEYALNGYQTSGAPGVAGTDQDYRQVTARYVCPASSSGYKSTSSSLGNTCPVAEQKTMYAPSVNSSQGANQANTVMSPDGLPSNTSSSRVVRETVTPYRL